jgi:hypothetical protein
VQSWETDFLLEFEKLGEEEVRLRLQTERTVRSEASVTYSPKHGCAINETGVESKEQIERCQSLTEQTSSQSSL